MSFIFDVLSSHLQFLWYDFIVKFFIALQHFLANHFRPFPIEIVDANNSSNTSSTIRNEDLKELEPVVTTKGGSTLHVADTSQMMTTKNKIRTIDDAVEEAINLKRLLVVFAHSEVNDRSVAALSSLRKSGGDSKTNVKNRGGDDDDGARRLIQEKFVFFAYSVLDREMKFTPGFLTSCRSLPAVAVFAVKVLSHQGGEERSNNDNDDGNQMNPNHVTSTPNKNTDFNSSAAAEVDESFSEAGPMSHTSSDESFAVMSEESSFMEMRKRRMMRLSRRRPTAMAANDVNESSVGATTRTTSKMGESALLGGDSLISSDSPCNGQGSHHQHHHVELLATLEGAATSGTIALFLERCLATY